jgi:RNA polymerase primary sigma factor
MVTRSAANKKINKALEKLYEHIWDSELKYWINGYLALFKNQ